MESVNTAPIVEEPAPVVVEPPHVCVCNRPHIDVSDADRACIEHCNNNRDIESLVRDYCAEMVRGTRRMRLMEAAHYALRTGEKLPAEDDIDAFIAKCKQ